MKIKPHNNWNISCALGLVRCLGSLSGRDLYMDNKREAMSVLPLYECIVLLGFGSATVPDIRT
jgi:hypothetical protein